LPGVVLGSTLAALPMIENGPAALLMRLAGSSLTTAIVDSARLALYRCTELSANPEPQALLDETFPAVAYFQDIAKRNIERVLLAGLDGRDTELRGRLEKELGCLVAPLGGDAADLPEGASQLLSKQLASLVGWQMNRGA
jgi:hypothetical protein